jgi:hypothetical protein
MYLLLQPEQLAREQALQESSDNSDKEELQQWIIISNSRDRCQSPSPNDDVFEDDKIAILEQFPMQSVYTYLFTQVSTRPQAIHQAVQFLSSILCIGVALHRQAAHFCKMLAKQVVGLCNGFVWFQQQLELHAQYVTATYVAPVQRVSSNAFSNVH